MSVISDIEQRVLQRLGDPGLFWSLQDEIRPFIVEAMNEATLITGDPEIRQSVATAIPAQTRLVNMPAGALALLRVDGLSGLAVRKVSLWDMDRMIPSWELDTDISLGFPGQLKYWFPFGLTSFCVYPLVTAQVNVVLSYVALPVTVPRPYTGSENVPFQVEYQEAFEEYGAHVARLKEGTQEFFDGLPLYDHFLAKMGEASKYADRKGVLRFSRAKGVQAAVTEVAVR